MTRFARLATVLVLLSMVASFIALGAAPDAAASGGGPTFDSLTPAPFTTVSPGPVLIGAHATSDAPLTSVTLALNGTQIEQIGSQSESFLAISQQRVLAPGVYTATVAATDANRQNFQAQWDFIVSSDANEGEWFTGTGQPKADQINATMRSLVEAFRWHLYGLSWDGANHPDLPSHVGFQGTGDQLTPWVTGTTFDQANTTATLRSLVEAFRWHFWGISWDGANHPDVPTHADSVQPPQSIDPWFTASGDPIPANISATLRSLVEAFRWHFWGYSWDGSPHPDMPTHASFGLENPPAEGTTIYQSSLTDVAPINSALGSIGTPTANGYSLTVLPNVADGISNSSTNFSDASYSLSMRKLTATGDATGCLLFRIIDTPTGGLYQACFVYSGASLGRVHLMYLANSNGSTSNPLADLAQYSFVVPLNGSDWNTLKVIAQGNQFWVYANDNLLGDVSHSGNSSGVIGFSVYNLTADTNETIEFTNLTVKGLQAGTASADTGASLAAVPTGAFTPLSTANIDLAAVRP